MTVSTINLLVLRTDKQEQLVEFYEALGLNFAPEKHGNGPVHHSCSIGGSTLEIYPKSPGGPSTTGTRLGFAVQSMSDLLARLPHKDAIISKPSNSPWGKRCVLEDPEGHKVELLEETK